MNKNKQTLSIIYNPVNPRVSAESNYKKEQSFKLTNILTAIIETIQVSHFLQNNNKS